jgi:DNA-binding MarR family transcriptional regulator
MHQYSQEHADSTCWFSASFDSVMVWPVECLRVGTMLGNRTQGGGMHTNIDQRQSELANSQWFDWSEHEVILSVLRTSDQFLTRFNQLFREHDITLSQHNLLLILRSEGRPMCSRELAERMELGETGMPSILTRLEVRGFVIRNRSSDDARIVYSEPTTAALELLKRLDSPITELQRSMVGHLAGQERKTLVRLLGKVRIPLGK